MFVYSCDVDLYIIEVYTNYVADKSPIYTCIIYILSCWQSSDLQDCTVGVGHVQSPPKKRENKGCAYKQLV